MKTLVVSKHGAGTWLADHLGCTLYNADDLVCGNGIVTTVDELQDVWDKVVFTCNDDLFAYCLSAQVIGVSALSNKMSRDSTYMRVLLGGEGLNIVHPNDCTGINVGVMGWWTGDEWVNKAALIIEQTGFMNRDLGVECNWPQGITTLSLPYDCPLIANTLNKITNLLVGYTGPVCMKLNIVGKHISVIDVDLGFAPGWMEACIETQIGGLLDNPMNLSNSIGMGIHVSVAPYPYTELLSADGFAVRISKLNAGAIRHAQFKDIVKDRRGYLCPLTTGSLFYATAWGDTIKEAKMRIYRSLRGVEVEDKAIQYRTDIGSKVVDDCLEQLTTLGLIC